MKVKLTVEVNNVPDYPLCRYIVARINDDTRELWFLGTFDFIEDARYAVERMDNAIILERD